MKNILKKAHELTREIKKEFPEVDYKTQLGICISYLYNKEAEEVISLETIEEAAKKYCEGYSNGWYANYCFNNWIKGNNNRTYITIKEYRNGSMRSEIKCGYWDNNLSEYVAIDRYSKVLNLLTLERK